MCPYVMCVCECVFVCVCMYVLACRFYVSVEECEYEFKCVR